jgi:hypothetical protein
MKREWTGLILGAWILVSPWLLGFSALGFMKWSNVLIGLVLVLINAWALFGKESKSDPI